MSRWAGVPSTMPGSNATGVFSLTRVRTARTRALLRNGTAASYLASRRRVPGALELLRALDGRVRIAVVTNNTVAEQTNKLATFGLAALVDALVTSEEIGAAKPDGRIFAAALRRIDCAPADAVMLGDSWTHDVVGATSAGIRAIWFNRNGAAHPDPDVAPQITTLLPTVESRR